MTETPARSYRGVAPADRVAQRHDALLEAALDSLYEEGLAGLGVRAVCTRAKLTARYFYESFADVDALLIAIVDAVCVEVAGHAVESLQSAGEDLASKVHAAVKSAVTVLTDDPRKASAFLLAAAGPEALHDLREEWMTQFVQLVLTNLPVPADGSLDGRRAARGAAFFVMGGTTEMLRAVLSGSLAMSTEAVVEQLSSQWLAVLT